MIDVYATTENGEGFSERIGKYPSWDNIKIRIGLFNKDTVITFHETNEEEE